MTSSQATSPSCAVLVRGMHDEAPYLDEFVAHYISLGFDHIYYINTSGGDDYVNLCVNPDLRGRISVLNLPNTRRRWQEAVINEAMQSIREQWFLSVDADEFLYLGGRTIQQFLGSLGGGVESIRFQWLMCLSTRYVQDSVFDILSDHCSESKMYKPMARTAAVTGCRIHDVATRGRGEPFTPGGYGNQAFILHFACRGFYDLVNRIVGRKYENAKTGPREAARLAAFFRDVKVSTKAYPFRFNMYRVEMSVPPANFDVSGIRPAAAGKTDNDRLRCVFLEKMRTIGVTLPENLGAELDDYTERTFLVRERLMRDLPAARFVRLHLKGGRSYMNAAQAYIGSLR